jgi:hypothetical protein
MSHPLQKPTDTSFHPLCVNDLDTPKYNRIDSNSPPPPGADIEVEAEFTTPNHDLKSLRHALLGCIGILDRMDRAQAKQRQRRPVSVQTSAEPGRAAPDAQRPEHKEVVFVRQPEHRDPSPIPKVVPSAKARPASRPEGEARKPLEPVNRNTVEARAVKTEVSDGSTDGTSVAEEDGVLQKRLHEMSLLLKRLENQIDGVNETASPSA